ncbi:MAG: hypothetical protein GXP39_09715 [Chloroflexi bacterium]|nr:hypothetical protein [Chloroflexota bacterium]
MKKPIPFFKMASWIVVLGLPVALIILMLRLASAATAPAAPAAAGFLDPDFGNGGRVIIPIAGTNQIARDVAIQPDGKLIIAGYDKWGTSDHDAILARVNPDGSLDGTFGTGGIVTTALSAGDDAIYAIALQPDGKIVAAGLTKEGGRSVAALMRYRSNGTLDADFGNNGVVTASLQPAESFFLSVAVLDDGRIVAGGTVVPPAASSSPRAFLLAQYRPNGAPDPSLGGGGVVTTTIPGGDANSWDMAVQSDGKIILAGYVRAPGGGTDWALVRYNADGGLDTGFGANGVVTQNVGFRDYSYGVSIQSDGKIVLGGLTGRAGGLARYHADGSYDNSFGSITGANFVTMVVPGYNTSVFIETALRADDGIVAATRMSGGDGPSAVGITGFDRNGHPDSRFGPYGVITTTEGTHTVSCYALLTQPDRKIVLAGHVDMDDTDSYEMDLALWRFVPRGKVYLPIVAR